MPLRNQFNKVLVLSQSLLILTLHTVTTHAQQTSSTTLSRTTTATTSQSWTPLLPNPSYTHPSNLPTLSFPLPTTTSDPTIPGLPPTSGSYGRPPTTSPEEQKRDNLVNLYFVFLLLLVLAAALVAWLYYRRRKVRTEAIREGRRDALERDLSASAGAGDWFSRNIWGMGGSGGRRRWMPGGRKEEGLDERGQAPPPYEPREEGTGLRDLEPRLGKPPDYDREVVEIDPPAESVGRSGSSRSAGSTVRDGREGSMG
ncbi:hypothetical protein KVT40_007112 [Elsinoe batatas]|uniref:Uncharacterized protein n=1 Tax=Elsinoe batatas TaxID=2601811 RepID=A0A8K0KWH0_9PEZI|nr:hypothetical protein KVT40_007112 [Elsinoe batatas]